ncbi:MAG: CDP-alcohol phosphatidyltransferase family protein [Longimicrobiales bacterium]
MATVDQRGSGLPTAHRPRGALRDLGVALVLALLAVDATWWLLGLTASYVLAGLVVYVILARLLLRALPPDLPGPGIGRANRVTLARAALAVPVLALALVPPPPGDAAAWWIIAVSTVVMALDGLDGRVARRTGTESPFGARFDMELDAALILALSVLVWRSGRIGPWVLLIGLMRYGFVAASWLWPALAAELPPSLRRKVVCVVQGVVLLVALGPIIPDAVAIAVSALGLVALTYSFAVDVRWALVAAGKARVS